MLSEKEIQLVEQFLKEELRFNSINDLSLQTKKLRVLILQKGYSFITVNHDSKTHTSDIQFNNISLANSYGSTEEESIISTVYKFLIKTSR